MSRIDLVPRGWEQDAWIGEFYPDDLPAARRLLEGLAGRPGSAPAVVILDPVSPDALHRWWRLAYLAGLA